jgi:carbamoyl-phosphate synthase small subunit
VTAIRDAVLVLTDGTTFEGEAIGATPEGGIATGEVVFNTVLHGYQEVISDPSYAGQIITFTYPHIGNYGVNPTDDEGRRPFCRGVVVREPARRRSNWRATEDLDAWLVRHGIPGIGGIDTRRLTRHIRDTGAMPGAFGALGEAPDGTVVDEASLQAAATAEPGTDGVDLVAQVTTDAPYVVGGDAPFRVVAYDFGIKATILRHLAGFANVTVVPADTPADEVLAYRPHGVFLSNGPGDPQAVPYAVDATRELLGKVPVFGICLGHQILGLALGADTVKLPFGHHGGNHPVRRVRDGRVEITSQNHNFAIDPDTLVDAEVTHVNLNDGVVQGIAATKVPAFSVQHHPEAGPGPHDASYLFDDFAMAMAGFHPAEGLPTTPKPELVTGVEPDGLAEGHLRRAGDDLPPDHPARKPTADAGADAEGGA